MCVCVCVWSVQLSVIRALVQQPLLALTIHVSVQRLLQVSVILVLVQQYCQCFDPALIVNVNNTCFGQVATAGVSNTCFGAPFQEVSRCDCRHNVMLSFCCSACTALVSHCLIVSLVGREGIS